MLASTSSPHPIVGHEELELVMARPRRAAAAADRHRRAARHRPAVRRARGRHAARHRRPAGGRRAQPLEPRRRRARAPRRSSRRRSSASRSWLGAARRAPDDRARCARAATRSSSSVLAENAGRWESASPRDLARVEALARAVVARLLHEPTIRLEASTPSACHGSIELLRDLFALSWRAAATGAGARRAAGRTRATTCGSCAAATP